MEEILSLRLARMALSIRHSEVVHGTDFSPVQPVESSEIEEAIKAGFSESFTSNYHLGAQFIIRWVENEPATNALGGEVRILSLKNIIQKLSSSNFDPKNFDDDDPILDFHVVDEFSNEVGVGIYAGKSSTNSLYYFAIDETPVYLGLDFSGYLEMIITSRGFLYWQKAILSIRNNTEYKETEKFKEQMPRLFPGWTWEGFVSKYESLRIEEDAY